jgi:putative FmdB family regulatory protein
MPIYEYNCPKCKSEFERVLPLAQYLSRQKCDCGAVAKKVIPSSVGVIFKGDDWVSKANRVNGQMAKKNRKLDARQAERKRDGAGVSLVPNVGGESVRTWSDAQKLAASKGKNAASYAPKVREEQSKRR